MQKVRKAIIPAAGLGTRFLPATKAVAKEMLPIVDKPTFQFIVEESKASGIEDILVVTGKAKRPIEDHFDANLELEQTLAAKGKHELLKLVEETTDINLHFIRQSRPLGLGHAVLQAKSFVGNEPFVVMLGDDIMFDQVPLTKQLMNNYEKTNSSTIAVMQVPLTKQLMNNYEKTNSSTIAVMQVPHEETSKYGIVAPESQLGKGLYNVKNFVEKPKPEEAPSDLAIIGRYLLRPEIFEILENQQPGAGNEIQLTDAIDTLNKTQRVFAHQFTGKRYDVGDKLGMVQANVELGLKHPEIGSELRKYLKELAKTL